MSGPSSSEVTMAPKGQPGIHTVSQLGLNSKLMCPTQALNVNFL